MLYIPDKKHMIHNPVCVFSGQTGSQYCWVFYCFLGHCVSTHSGLEGHAETAEAQLMVGAHIHCATPKPGTACSGFLEQKAAGPKHFESLNCMMEAAALPEHAVTVPEVGKVLLLVQWRGLCTDMKSISQRYPALSSGIKFSIKCYKQ